MRIWRRTQAKSGNAIVVRAVVQFTVAGLVAAAIVGVALSIASRRVGEREAIVDARTQTLVHAQGFVEPVLTNTLAQGDPASIAKLDEVVRRDVLGRSLVRVKVWTRDGRIVYSDEKRLIGTSYHLGASEVATIDRGEIEAEVSDLTRPENRYERANEKLLEVYLPVRQPNGDRLLFEAYFRYDAVSANGSRVWRSFAPISLGALLALELVQIPLAWSLARQVRQRQREREGLLQDAIDAQEVERRRIASDLHDGVVQDLAGVAFALGGAARQSDLSPNAAALLERSAGDVRESIRALRSLLVEIYPPNLFEEGLDVALTDLGARAAARGVVVDVDVVTTPDLPHRATALLYRAAQEAIRNVISHSRADSATIVVRVTDTTATLDVRDNGIGFDPKRLQEAPKQGHFGLDALTRLISDSGGRLDVVTTPNEGTHIHVEVPLT